MAILTLIISNEYSEVILMEPVRQEVPKSGKKCYFFSFLYLLRIKTHEIMERNVTIAKKSFVPLAVCIWYAILIFKVGLGSYFFPEMGKNIDFCRIS